MVILGQYEVYEWLKNRLESGDDRFFTPKDIELGMIAQGIGTERRNGAVRGDCFRLLSSGYLDMQDLDKSNLSNWKKVFRIKKQYAKTK